MLYGQIIIICSEIHRKHACILWRERRILSVEPGDM